MQLEVRVARLDRPEQIFVPLDRQIRVVTTLQQQLVSTERNRLVDLVENFLETEHVTVAMADLAVERAEVAARHADVRVIDVAVDDVGDDAFRMLARPDAVGERAEQVRWSMAIQLQRFGRIDTAAITDLAGYLIDHCSKNSSDRRRGARPRSAAWFRNSCSPLASSGPRPYFTLSRK